MFNVANFNVTEKIGSGSYSTVYKAKLKDSLSEYVAIKVVERAKLSSRGKDNIVTEIEVMKRLKHKHIVHMKEFKYDSSCVYIIMEYCDGGDLSSFIRKRCKLPEKICHKFLQQLAIGLRFLRSQNISHLDLKPQNLLLVTKPKLTLKIGDFGFAQYLSDSTQKTSIRGSPLYMAPEMLLGQAYDAKADLWSVGVITYECLFGKAPYSSGSYEELYNKIKTKSPIAVPSNVNLSEDCVDFLKKLLQHDPAKRITYDKFYQHSFLDLEHAPSDTSYNKAKKLFATAERYEKTGRYMEAFNTYCEGLRFLFPLYKDEEDEEKKASLRNEVSRFTKRAENLKSKFSVPEEIVETRSSKRKQTGAPIRSDSASDVDEVDSISKPCRSKAYSINELMSLCSNTPSLSAALEIGVNAQMYLAEGNYKLALEKFQSSLGLLLPCLASEPVGRRKELLYLQIQEWMKQAESTKSLLSMNEFETTPLASEYRGKTKKFRNLVLLKFLNKNNLL